MRILVCGGRDFGDVKSIPGNVPGDDPERLRIEREYQFVFKTLDAIAIQRSALYNSDDNWLPSDITIISGKASGADQVALDWATVNWLNTIEFVADWNDFSPPCKTKYTATGKPYNALAGFKRNQEMIDKGKPDLVVAFPGNTGTKDMIHRAKKANIEVMEITC